MKKLLFVFCFILAQTATDTKLFDGEKVAYSQPSGHRIEKGTVIFFNSFTNVFLMNNGGIAQMAFFNRVIDYKESGTWEAFLGKFSFETFLSKSSII